MRNSKRDIIYVVVGKSHRIVQLLNIPYVTFPTSSGPARREMKTFKIDLHAQQLHYVSSFEEALEENTHTHIYIQSRSSFPGPLWPDSQPPKQS
jgi:hypothetical protein